MTLMMAACRVINMLNYTAHPCNPEGGSHSQRMLGRPQELWSKGGKTNILT